VREDAGVTDEALPHPVTGALFPSPVPPGTGWPGDPADADTPVARTTRQAARLANSSATREEVDARSSVCRACPRLVRWREQVATTRKRASFAAEPYWGRPGPSFGDPDAEVLVMGLAPAANGANRTGRMFTGDKSGDWLFAALHRAGYANQDHAWAAGDGLVLTGIRIVAAVRCAPPDNKPTTTERDTCSAWLDRDLQLCAPKLRSILCLGSFGWDAVLASARRLGWSVPRPKPKFGHGAEAAVVTDQGHGIRLLGTYHPSQHNTFTGRLTTDMFDAVLARL
jgi:uracil-DNA glycosylase family 4